MRYYFAPLEGITDSIFRKLHSKYFPGVDRYYTPFLSPTVHRGLTAREAREIPPADTLTYEAVPQLLTKVAEDFLWLAGVCKDLGYQEVNLNTGCPSGTVTAKGKGSGMLRDLKALEGFLDEIYGKSPLPVSIKTRIGFYDKAEFPAILELYNQYPVKELTIHPRIRTQFYKGDVDMEVFQYALQNSKNPLCYNGDLISLKKVRAFESAFPQVESVMIGRGLVGDPGMLSPDGTEEGFAQFAMNHTEDPGSMATGGLYTDVYVGQMVEPFEDWCFDASRQYGDTGLVRTNYGYHIMYFVESREVWVGSVQDTIISERSLAIVDEAVAKWPMEVKDKKIVLGERVK